MELHHNLDALQQAADYSAVKTRLRKTAKWWLFLGGLNIASFVSSIAVFVFMGVSPAPAAFPCFLPAVALVGFGIAFWVAPRPWGFIVCAVPYFTVAGGLVLAVLPMALLGCAGGLHDASIGILNIGALLAGLLIGLAFTTLVFLPFVAIPVSAGLRRIRLYRRFSNVRMRPPEPAVEKEVDAAIEEVRSACGKDDERVVLILSEQASGSYAKARLDGDLATVVVGDGWHAIFARRSEVAFTPLGEARPHRPLKGLLQLGQAGLTVQIEPQALARLNAWLSDTGHCAKTT